jgi:hypothetical protein
MKFRAYVRGRCIGEVYANPEQVDGSRWVTIPSGRKVLLSEDGRILAGKLPRDWQGVHVHDLAELSRQLREAEKACQGDVQRLPQTFPTPSHGVRALLGSNPNLVDFLEHECSWDCKRWNDWNRAGRVGPKPTKLHPGDGRFDLINERYEKRGARAAASWIEAVYATVPPSRRWDDFADRIATLSEASGLDLLLPDPAEQIALARESAEACEQAIDRELARILETAKASRLQRGRRRDDDPVPF